MPKAYRYEWTGPHTGTEYRLDFIDHATPFIWPPSPIEPMPDDCVIDINGFEWDTGDWPCGLATPPRMKVTFAAGSMPSDMVTWMQTTSTGLVNLTPPPFTPVLQVEFQRGMAVALWADGQVVWHGTLDLGQQMLPDLKTGRMTVEFTSCIQAALKALTWDAIKEADLLWLRANKVTDASTRAAIEAVWQTDDDRWAYIGNVAPNNERNGEPASRFWFGAMGDMYTRWEYYCSRMIAGFSSRVPTLTLNLYEMRGSFRKQNYQPNGGAGAALGENDVYRLLAVASSLNNDAEIQYTWYDELAEKSKCFWDWLVDYCDESMSFCAFTQTGITLELKWFLADGSRTGSTLNLTTSADIRDVKVELRSKVLRVATASTEFTVNEDYDKAEETKQGGRNDTTDTVAVVTRSSPVIAKYIFANLDGRHTQSTGVEWTNIPPAYWYDPPGFVSDPRKGAAVAYGYWPRFGGYYYKDQPTGAYNAFSTANAMIRCHSWQGLDGSAAPATGVALPAVPMANVGGLASTATAWAIADQQQYGTLREVATKAMDTFGDPNGSQLTVKTRLDEVAYWPGYRTVTLDLAAISPIANWLSGAPTEWWPYRCVTNLKEELMEVTCYGK